MLGVVASSGFPKRILGTKYSDVEGFLLAKVGVITKARLCDLKVRSCLIERAT